MYIFDTNVFSTFQHYYRSRFPSLWEKLDSLVDGNKIYSVRETLRELERFNPSHEVADWVSTHKRIFLMPSEEEIRIVTSIMNNSEYRALVARKKIRNGDPVADPFLIASAKCRNATLVTQEKDEGIRIPKVCRDLEVRCINLETFLDLEELVF